jgi:hypothetical protein
MTVLSAKSLRTRLFALISQLSDMKKAQSLLIFAFFLSFHFQAYSQQTQEAQLVLVAQNLSWMIGNWQGDGQQGGISYSSSLLVKGDLDGTVVIADRDTTGGFKEAILIGFDKGSSKYVATVFDSQKHIALFGCDLSSGQIACSQLTAPSGFQSKRTLRLGDPNTIVFTIEGGKTGEQMAKTIEITYHKK